MICLFILIIAAIAIAAVILIGSVAWPVLLIAGALCTADFLLIRWIAKKKEE